MLQSLYIKNFVLMDEIRLDFDSGMSVFTGETGAGKSITIDAIALLMGERFQSHYMKDPQSITYLEATFTTSNPGVLAYLRESGWEIEEGELIVAREFRPDGKSRAFLNHRSVNASMLKETIGQMVDIHSQHQNQYLLNKKYHLQLLDRYLRNPALIQEVASQYSQYRALIEEKAAFLESDAFTDIDYVRFQWQEIEDLQFDFEQYHEIQDRHKRMGAFEKNQQTLNGVLTLLEEESNPASILYDVQRQLDHVEGDEMRAISDELKNIYYTLEDVVERIHAFADESTFDEEQFVQDQEYLFKINKIVRKYHNSFEEMVKKQDEY
ncbi:MAG: AAA family ATPase, partial [Erysipelotrichaceae bacterium]